MVCTIVGYLTITVLSQVAPRMRSRQQFSVLGVMSAFGTLLAYLVSAILVGFYGASFAANLAMLAVAFAYTVIVGLSAFWSTGSSARPRSWSSWC